MAPLGPAGWRECSSSARAVTDSLLLLSARVSADKTFKRRSAHSLALALLVLMVPTVVGSRVYPVSNRLIIEYGQLGLPVLEILAAFAGLHQ